MEVVACIGVAPHGRATCCQFKMCIHACLHTYQYNPVHACRHLGGDFGLVHLLLSCTLQELQALGLKGMAHFRGLLASAA